MKTTLIILLLSSSAAFARLGESNTEIMARYGAVKKRTETGTNTWTGAYLFKGYVVIVNFRDNKSEVEGLRPFESRKITDDEREALMKSIGGDGEWKQDNSTFEFLSKTWINSQTHAVAYMKDELLGASTLVVMSMDACLRNAEEQKKKEKSKADGF